MRQHRRKCMKDGLIRLGHIDVLDVKSQSKRIADACICLAHNATTFGVGAVAKTSPRIMDINRTSFFTSTVSLSCLPLRPNASFYSTSSFSSL